MAIKTIKLGEIRPNPVALRQVAKDSEEFLGLVASIRNMGFRGAISARQKKDAESGVTFYELIDGLHRYTAAVAAGLEEIPVDIVAMDDAKVLEAQTMANFHRIVTKPVEYSKQLQRMLNFNPMMKEHELAEKLGVSKAWVEARLGLQRIDNNTIKALIDEGKISLSNAFALSRLPSDEMAEWVDRAVTLPPDQFVPAVQQRVKDIRDAKRKGDDAPEEVWNPSQFLRKISEIKSELESPRFASALAVNLSGEEAFLMGLKWVMHVDPQSVEVQKAQEDERRKLKAEAEKKREQDSIKRKQVKAEKLAKEAAEAAAEATAAANPSEG
jgi:ParB/RepB/Spo0J family partition protein